MANGDRNVERLYTQNLPGGGQDADGNPKQGKVFTISKVTGTYLELGSNGVDPVWPRDLGLESIDMIHLEVAQLDAVENTVASPLIGRYNRSTGIIVLWKDDAGDEADNADAFDVRVLAVGDSAAAPELL